MKAAPPRSPPAARARSLPPTQRQPIQGPTELANQALDMVGQDPRAAARLAAQALAAAAAHRDGAATTTALRAQGLAARALGEMVLAEQSLRRAVALADRRHDRHSAAEARMTMSFVQLDAGKFAAALRTSARAAIELDGVEGARLLAQRGLILQRCGRRDEALAAYATALEVLRPAGDWRWEARVCSNRGVLQAYHGALSAAEADLQRARAIELTHEQSVDAATSLWNLGFVASRRGDAVTALARFDEAESTLGAHDFAAQRLVDRADVLLSMGVASEARVLAERAAAELVRTGQSADLVECRVLQARAALLDDDPVQALQAAQSARRSATRQGRGAWVLVARHLEVLALEAQGAPSRGLLRRAEQVAQGLDAASWPDAAADARLAAARIALRQGRPAHAEDLLRPLAQRSGSMTADLRVRQWHATALLRHSRGDRKGARSAVRSALGLLERHRAGLGATDLQVHVPTLGTAVARLGLDFALSDGSPSAVLTWLERWRAQNLRARPVRPPTDLAMSDALATLRRVSAELVQARMGASPTGALESARTAAECNVVRLSRLARSGSWRPAGPSLAIPALRRALGPAALVELFALDDELYAITVLGAGRRDGAPRLHRLGAVARCSGPLEHLQFALSRLATGRGSPAALAAAMASARDSAHALDQLLLAPLAPSVGSGPLVLVPSALLAATPWNLLPSAGGRPLHIVPSATAWWRAGQEAATRAPGGGTAFAAGPGLTHAEGEARDLGAATPGATSVTGARATVAEVLDLMTNVEVAHLSTHGTFHADNPMLSSLRLHDGPLTIYDLEGLRRLPRLVVLAACHSAAVRVHAGHEVLGLAHALLWFGAGGVVATSLPTPDLETSQLMRALHARLSAGEAPAVALAAARDSLDRGTPAGYATAAGFEYYGG